MTTIDLNRIAVFVRVVEAGSFTAAAKTLGVPVSSVSRSLAHLESDLGVRLLHRTTRKLSLTDGGQHFFQRMQNVVSETEEATRAVTGFANTPRGLVRITAPPGLGGLRLPQLITKLTRRFPELTIELKLTNQVVDLVAEGIDLAVRGGVLPDSSLVARKISTSELGIFASPEYLERRGKPRTPADLFKHDCLCYGGRNGKLPWRLSGPKGEQTVAVSGSIVCDDMLFLRGAAVSGSGLALLPVELTVAAIRTGQLVRVLPRHGYLGGGIYLMWPSQKLVPARVVVVRDFLIEELAVLYRSGLDQD
jgi:DNA-binding transcriptional LysR family regulator